MELAEVKASFPSIIRVLFNRELAVMDAPCPCIYDYSCMTMLSMERLVTQVIPLRGTANEPLKIGVVNTRHKNDISKQESQHAKAYLLNSQALYFPILDLNLPPSSQEQVALLIHKLPYHFTPYAEKHQSEHLSYIYERAALFASAFHFYEPLESLKIVGGRAQFKRAIEKHLAHIEQKVPLLSPRWFLINEEEHELTDKATCDFIMAEMKRTGVSFPLVLQSDNATTHSAAHNLAIVKSEVGLQKLLADGYFVLPRDGPDLIASEFIEH